MNDGGKIIIHDMIPKKWEMECVPRIYNAWNGDVWKIGVELAKSSGINIRIFDCDQGVGIVERISSNYTYYRINKILCNQNFKDFLKHLSALPIFQSTSFHNLYFKNS